MATWRKVVTENASGNINNSTIGTSANITGILGTDKGGLGRNFSEDLLALGSENSGIIYYDGTQSKFTLLSSASGASGQSLVYDGATGFKWDSVQVNVGGLENNTLLTTTGDFNDDGNSDNSINNLTVGGTITVGSSGAFVYDVDELTTTANLITLNNDGTTAINDIGVKAKTGASTYSQLAYETSNSSGESKWKIKNETDSHGANEGQDIALFQTFSAAPTSSDSGVNGVGTMGVYGSDLYVRIQ